VLVPVGGGPFRECAQLGLFSRFTYSPITPGLSSMPVCDETPELALPKKLPSPSIVVAPSAVWSTISLTVCPLREL
jgi:hypothetical protein